MNRDMNNEDDLKNQNSSNIEDHSSIATTNQVDSNKINVDKALAQVANKIDTRNFVDYTFLTTSEEAFNHPLGRLPSTVIIAGQNGAANIRVNIFSSTKTKLYATSSVAGIKARFVLG